MTETVAPWTWSFLDAEECRDRWHEFVPWVRWLENAFQPWVVLPPCWPLHEGLASELRVFWYWHDRAFRDAQDPIDAVRWHQELRRSADAWREIVTCAHEPPLVQQGQLAAQRRARTDDAVRLVLGNEGGEL